MAPPSASGISFPMSGPEIRDATIADLEALLALEREAFPGDRLSRRSFRRLLRAPSARLRVAGRGHALHGYALVLFRANADVARLYSIAVAPAARGAGIGGRLLVDAERQAAARGSRTLRLEVRTDNAGALTLYRRRGYVPVGRVAAYYEDGRDALRFEKAVAPRHRPRRRGEAAGEPRHGQER